MEVSKVAGDLVSQLLEGSDVVDAWKKVEALKKYGQMILDVTLELAEEKLDDWVSEEEICPMCLEDFTYVKLENGRTHDEYMGDYGSERAYQTVVDTLKCPKCDYEEGV